MMFTKVDNNKIKQNGTIVKMARKWYFSLSLMVLFLVVCSNNIEITASEWIDVDTPLDKRTTTSLVDGSIYHLVRVEFRIRVTIVNCFVVVKIVFSGD
jgi:hypothetical protein